MVFRCAAALAASLLASPASAGSRLAKPITGTFIQLDAGNLCCSLDQWNAEFEAMRRLGCDTLIVGEVVRQDHAFCRIPGYPLYPGSGTPDPFRTILDCAARHGFRVFVGTYSWDWSDQSPKAFEEYARRCRDVASLVWKRYGSHAAFAGWYVLGWEIGNAPPPDNIGVKAHIAAIERMRELAPRLPILIAPYFTLDVTPEQFEKGWKELFKSLDVDIMALQDGVGCGRGITPQLAKPYFRAMLNACRTARVIPWADVEVFDQPAGWKTASPERVLEQLMAVGPFVEKTVIWEFNHYLSPSRRPGELDALLKAAGKR